MNNLIETDKKQTRKFLTKKNIIRYIAIALAITFLMLAITSIDVNASSGINKISSQIKPSSHELHPGISNGIKTFLGAVQLLCIGVLLGSLIWGGATYLIAQSEGKPAKMQEIKGTLIALIVASFLIFVPVFIVKLVGTLANPIGDKLAYTIRYIV